MGRGSFGRERRIATLLVGLALLVVVTVMASRAAQAQGGVALVAGWNNVGYAGETIAVEEALSNVAEVVGSVWHWEAATANWTSYFPGVPVATNLRSLERGESYWIRARQAAVWEQPTGVLFESVRVALTRMMGATLTIEVELADTASRRSRGLMFRASVAADGGMLFVWPTQTSGGFWMQNTFVPLSIAFVDADGLIIDIQDMEPETTTLHRPPSPYRWALEVNQGWFAAQGIARGDRVELTGA